MEGPSEQRQSGPVAVVSMGELLGTSLWFSANSTTNGLMQSLGEIVAGVGTLTHAAHVGFIAKIESVRSSVYE